MKIAYLSIGMTSPLHASLELCRRLVAAGHEVTVVSHADIEKTVRTHGHDFVRLTAHDELVRRAEPLAWRDLLRPARFLRILLARRRAWQRSLVDDELEQVLEKLAPDRLVIDLELHPAILAVRQLGIPIVLVLIFFSVHRRPGLPPLHTPLRPATSTIERLRIHVAWWRAWLERLHYEWRQRLGRWKRCEFFRPVLFDTFDIDDLRATARARGVSLRHEISRGEWLRPYMYTRLPVLSTNARELDWPQEPPSNLTYVGPMVHLHRIDPDETSLSRWRTFLAHRDSDRPLIYASLGSFWAADRVFLTRLLAVFDQRPEWDLVLGLGGRLDAADLEPIPDNALVLDWAPQLDVLTHADVAITHGGIASINECVRLGVPMLVYSTGFVEQDGNSARVAHHGVGILGDKDRDGVLELDAKLATALDHPAIRRNIAIMREHFIAYERADLACRLIEAAEVVS